MDEPKETSPELPQERVAETLSRLRAGVRQRQGEVAALNDGGRLPPGVVDLLARARIEEPIPVSARPVVGRLVVLSRKLAFHLFVKWWVRPVLQQQNRFNQLVAQRLVDQGEREVRLQRRVEALEARLEELERE